MTLERSPSEQKQESDTALAPPPTLIGQVLGGRYRVTALLGTGGMGAVYRAEHTELKRPVALKVLSQEMAAHREAALRFEREALVSAQIQHPHVVSATDSGRLPDGSLYLVLELVEGRSLRELIDRERRFEPARALALGAQIAEALAAAHRVHVVHRDLKPSNVMVLGDEPQREFVKVLDFGLARVATAGEALTRTGSVFGTPEYMAPEQARGEVADHRADLYALGVILYELLSGRQPFVAPELVAILLKHIQEPPPPLPADVPAPLASYVLALLEKDPKRRPADALQVAKALRRLAPPAAPSGAPPPLARAPHPGAAPPPARALRRLGGELGRLSRRLGRDSLAGLTRVVQAAGAVCPDWLRGGLARCAEGVSRPLARARQPGAAAAVAAAVLIAAALAWSLWPRSIVPQALSDRARQGEPAALGELASVPAPDRGARASLALAIGYFKAGEHASALDALDAAIEDGARADTPELLRGVRAAVDVPASRERALELAARHLGRPGADLLYDVWVATPGKTPATRAARAWLDDPSVRKHASPALKLALEIREARGCTALRDLLPRVAEDGDERSLAPLRRLQSTTGCGFLGFEDCHSCLRKGSAVEDAISAVSARPAPKL